MEKENKYPSMDLTYEWGRSAPEQLSREASSLDTKIVGIFASASIIIGLMPNLIKQVRFDLSFIPFIISSLCFIIVFIISMYALKTRVMIIADNPKILKKDYWKLDPNKVKEEYWTYTIEAFERNLKAVTIKGNILKWSIPLLALEVVALVAWMLLIALL